MTHRVEEFDIIPSASVATTSSAADDLYYDYDDDVLVAEIVNSSQRHRAHQAQELQHRDIAVRQEIESIPLHLEAQSQIPKKNAANEQRAPTDHPCTVPSSHTPRDLEVLVIKSSPRGSTVDQDASHGKKTLEESCKLDGSTHSSGKKDFSQTKMFLWLGALFAIIVSAAIIIPLSLTCQNGDTADRGNITIVKGTSGLGDDDDASSRTTTHNTMYQLFLDKFELREAIGEYVKTGSAGTQQYGPTIEEWNVSAIDDFSYLFARMTSFNSSLSAWDVSAATNMEGMFEGASSFNGDLSRWNVSQVTEFAYMFRDAVSFSGGNLSFWSPIRALSTVSMFQNATAFNSDLSTWYMPQINSMASMFEGATSFDQDLCPWGEFVVTEAASVVVQNMFANTNCSYTQDPIGLSSSNGSFCAACKKSVG